MFVVVDASVWVSRLVEGDEFHFAVKDWMSLQREQETIFVAPSLLLAEVGGVISRVTGMPAQGLKSIERLEKFARSPHRGDG